MTELMKRYETETGMMAQGKFYDIDGWIEWFATDDYVQWCENRILRLESSIRALVRVVNLTDVPIPLAPEGEVK